MNEHEILSVQVLEFSGNSYDIGLEQSKYLESDKDYTKWEGQNAHIAEKILNKLAPNIQQEISGLANGIGLPLHVLMDSVSGYDMSFPKMGCTVFANDSFYTRNYDLSPELYDARFIFANPKEAYASVGFSEHIVGRLDGMNEKGLIIGLHLVNQTINKKGFMGTMIARIILDQCSNVNEAIELLKKIPHGYCFNYSLMDKEGNKIKVEASPNKQVTFHKDPFTCTNHFESIELMRNNTPNITDSNQRQLYLEKLSENNPTELDAYHYFNDEEGSLFYKNYKNYFGTLHTVVYVPERLEVIVGIGGNCTPNKFSLRNWLSDETSFPPSINGKISV